jgi:hypothetical protein
MATPIVTVDEVRHLLEDYDTTNMPLFSIMLEDPDLQKCIDLAVDDFNESPPILYRKYTIYDFPYKRLLLDGAVVEALKLTALKELRGEMQYSDGGISSTVYYKQPQFTAIRQESEQKYEQDKLRRRKVQLP